jgi:hypothetical protein
MLAALLSADDGAPSSSQPPEVIDLSVLRDSRGESILLRSRPVLEARQDGRSTKAPVPAAAGASLNVVREAVAVVLSAKDSYRLVVTQDLRRQIQSRESFVSITFQTPVVLRLPTGEGTMSLEALLVPLTGKWATPSQAVFAQLTGTGWAPLLWSAPPAGAQQPLIRALAEFLQ